MYSPLTNALGDMSLELLLASVVHLGLPPFLEKPGFTLFLEDLCNDFRAVGDAFTIFRIAQKYYFNSLPVLFLWVYQASSSPISTY